MKKMSAGVCIVHPTKPNHVLSCSRGLLPPLNWALVGGMGEEGETPMETALRECEEETGIHLLAIELLPDPYVADLEGWDTHFWLVKPTEHRMMQQTFSLKRATWEGWVAWKPISTVLAYKGFASYNRDLFEHFGIFP